MIAFLAPPVGGWLHARRPVLTPAAPDATRPGPVELLALAATMDPDQPAVATGNSVIGLAERLLIILAEVAVLFE